MAQKLAGLYIKLSADSADMKKDLAAIKRDMRSMGNRANREANRVKYAFNKIRRAAQVVASAFIFTAGVKQISRIVTAMAEAEDSVKLLEARFKQFARAGDSFTRVYNLSKELGVSLQETAGGMTRLLVATKSMGTAQSELEDVYKNIVLLGRAGGTSTEEMIGGMRQLSQGLASGRLQGEELRSVLENLPLVAMEIADQMGIGIGQIRQAAAEGKITGEVVIAALKEIGIEMDDLPKTWAMQTENLRTEWGLFLADLSKAVDEAGLLTALTDAVKYVRIELLGGFSGVSTGALRSQETDLLDRQAKIRKQLGSEGVNLDAVMTAHYLGDDSFIQMHENALHLREMAEEYINNTHRLREYNEELSRRANLEEIAKKAAQATGQATADAANDKEIKQLQSAADRLRDSIKTDQQEFFELVALMDELVAKTDLTAAEAKNIIEAKYLAIMEAAQEATEEEKRLLDEINKGVKEGAEKLTGYAKQMEQIAEQAARNIQDAFAEFFFDPFDDGLKGMVEGFLTAIRRMLANQLAVQFMNITGLAGLFPTKGGNAFGGFAQAGQAGLVGERGPELFIPSTNGTVVPALGGSTNNYYFEAGADVATIQAEIIPMLERTKEVTKSEMMQMKQEGRF